MVFQPSESIASLYSKMKDLPPLRDELSQRSFNGYLTTMEQINAFNSVDQYRIVFIGEPGNGKTTAICNWLNLLRTQKVGKDNIDAVTLLSTANGRTTVAEVHVRQTTGISQIRIEPVAIARQTEYIKDFCQRYFQKIKGTLDPMDGSDEQIPSGTEERHSEIERIIRNMAELEQLPSENDHKESSASRRKRVLQFMGQFSDQRQFTDYVLNKINLSGRQSTKLMYNSKMAFENWLRKNFREINNGKNKQFSIPDKIFIDINENDLCLHLPERVSEIIDTMGLESGVRQDLEEFLRAKDTICFIMDSSKAVPSSNVKTLLKHTFFKQDYRYCIAKTALFVNCTASELCMVNEADGDPERGKELKLHEIEDKIISENVQYDIPNTVFLDSCIAYEIKTERRFVLDPKTGRKIPDYKKNNTTIAEYSEDFAQYYRRELDDHIQGLITSLRKQLNSDAAEIQKQIEHLLQLEKEAADREAKAAAIRELAEKRKTLLEAKETFVPRFRPEDIIEAVIRKSVTEIHWRTVRKMNSLYGAYHLWHTDIYTQTAKAGEEFFANKSAAVCKYLKENLLDVRSPIARTFTEGYIQEMYMQEKAYTDEIGEEFLDWALNDRFAPQSDDLSFWQDVNKVWGTGYHRRVIYMYYAFIEEDGEKLASLLQSYMDRLINEIIDMLPQEVPK